MGRHHGLSERLPADGTVVCPAQEGIGVERCCLLPDGRTIMPVNDTEFW
jgi:hypothetical protein